MEIKEALETCRVALLEARALLMETAGDPEDVETLGYDEYETVMSIDSALAKAAIALEPLA